MALSSIVQRTQCSTYLEAHPYNQYPQISPQSRSPLLITLHSRTICVRISRTYYSQLSSKCREILPRFRARTFNVLTFLNLLCTTYILKNESRLLSRTSFEIVSKSLQRFHRVELVGIVRARPVSTPLFDDDRPSAYRELYETITLHASPLHRHSDYTNSTERAIAIHSVFRTSHLPPIRWYVTQVLVSMILLIILAIQYNIYFNTDGIYEEVRLTVDKEYEIVSFENRRDTWITKKSVEILPRESGWSYSNGFKSWRLETWKEMWDISWSKSKSWNRRHPRWSWRIRKMLFPWVLSVERGQRNWGCGWKRRRERRGRGGGGGRGRRGGEGRTKVTRTLSSTQSREEKPH